MADNNLNSEQMAELFEKLNRLLGDSTALMSDEQKAKKQSIEQEYDRIKQLEKSGKAEDIKMAAELKHKIQVDLNTKAKDANTKKVREATIQIDEQLALLKARNNEDRRELAEKQNQLDKARAIEDFKNKIAKMGADKTGTILNGITAMGSFANKTFLDSTKGQSKYGEALDSGANKLMGLSILFGPFGKAVTFAGAGLMKLAAMGLKHNEEMNKAYENLSEFGQVDSSGIPQLFKNLQNAGFVMKDMDKFQGIMKESSKDLAYLGNTAAEGQKAITDLYGKTLNDTTQRTLKNLGYTNEQALKTYINYSTNLSRLGLMQGRTQEQVQKESLRYAGTLDELSKLTGAQRDELQERQRRAEQDIKYRIAMARATPQMQEQIRMMSQSVAGGGEEFAAGVREMIANGGNAVTESGIKLQLNTAGAASRIIRQFNRGEIDYFTASKQLAEAMDKRDKSMRSATVVSGEVAAQYGQTAETMDWTNLMLNKSADARAKIEQDAALQASGQMDAQRSAETTRQINERKAEQAKDKLAQIVGKGISPAMEKLEIVTHELAKTFAKILKMLPFGPDLTEAFQSREEKLSEKEQKMKDVQEKLARAKASHHNKQTVMYEAQLEKLTKEIEDLKGTGQMGAPAELGPTSSMGNYLRKVAQVESGGKAGSKAGTSSAAGLFQFTEGTWNQTVKEMGKNYSSSDRFDPKKAAEVAQYFTQKQSGQLEKTLGRKPSDGELYMAHFLGAGGAIKFLSAMQKNPNGPSSEGATDAQMNANKSIFYEDGGKGKMRTLSEVYGLMSKKLDKAGDIITAGKGGKDLASIQAMRTGGLVSGPTSGYPVMLHGNEVVIPMDDSASLRSVQKMSLDKLTASDNTSSSPEASNAMVALATKLDSMLEYMRKSSPTVTASQSTGDIKVIADTLASKMDSVIEYLHKSSSTQEQLLQHARN